MLCKQYVEISVPATTIAVLIVHDDNNSMLTLIVHYSLMYLYVGEMDTWCVEKGRNTHKHKARTTGAKLFDFDPTNIHLNIQLVHLIRFLSSFIRTSGWR